MKNFIVSNVRKMWISGSKEIVFSSKFLENDNKSYFINNEKQYSTLNKHQRANEKEFIDDSNFVDTKYYKYLPILAKRLNKINKSNYSLIFWKKALGIGFIRSLTLMYEHFRIYNRNFNPDIHNVNLLDKKCFWTPENFEDQRILLNDNGFGNEQIFSLYISCFFPDHNFVKIFIRKPIKSSKPFKKKLLKLKNFIRNILNNSNPLVLILGSYFEKNIKNELINKSKVRIEEIFIFDIKSKNYNNNHRLYLSKTDKDFDDFDIFFFKSLEIIFPKIFMKSLMDYEKYFQTKLIKYNSAKIIFCENFLSNTLNSFFLAYAKEKRKIKHYYNEHNCFSHVFNGHFAKNVEDLIDKYYTIGWKSKKINIIKSSTLFDFKINRKKLPKDILFISAPYYEKFNHYSSFFGYCNEKLEKSINFFDSFFSKIPDDLVGVIKYKGYPKSNISRDKEALFKHFEGKFQIINPEIKAKKLMTNAKLLIIDYVSTAYLEGLLSDIPTIVLFDKNAYSLNENHSDFFDPLISCGIFQINPYEACDLLQEIHNNPLIWWNSENVKINRELFLRNIDNSNLLLTQILREI